jgi:hypothetical protein
MGFRCGVIVELVVADLLAALESSYTADIQECYPIFVVYYDVGREYSTVGGATEMQGCKCVRKAMHPFAQESWLARAADSLELHWVAVGDEGV